MSKSEIKGFLMTAAAVLIAMAVANRVPLVKSIVAG